MTNGGIEKMNKEEFKQMVTKKVALQEGEFEKLWQEKLTEATGFGVEEAGREDFAINNLFAYFKRQLSTKADKYEGLILGVGDATDFGATRTFNNAVAKWNQANDEVRKAMVESGEADSTGAPLWHAANTKAAFKYQDNKGELKNLNLRKIDLERERQKHIIMIARKEGATDFKEARMTLYGDKADLVVPVGKKVNFQATGKLMDETVYRLNSVAITTFIAGAEVVPHMEVLDLMNKYFDLHTFDLNTQNPDEWLSENADKKPVFIKNANIMNVIPSTGEKSHLVKFSAFSFEEEAKVITCWVPSDYVLNVAEGQSGVTVVGNLNKHKETGDLSMNGMGFFNPNKMMIPEPIKPEQEETPEQEGW